MSLRRHFFIFLMSIFGSASHATTYYSVANGNWTGAIWSSTGTTGTGVTFASLTLQDGDILVIDDWVSLNDQITISALITIELVSNSSSGARLNFQNGKKLKLTNEGSVINLSNTNPSSFPDPQINPGGGGGNSNYIEIGSIGVWNTADGPIEGTGQINEETVDGVLPITLLSFTADAGEDGVELNWATAMEENFDRFIIERSTNGLEFVTIGEVPGAGRNIYDAVTKYSFRDPASRIGLTYYRLKSIDLDLAFDYSNIVAVEVKQDRKVWVSPNPAISSINYYSNFRPSESDRLVLLDQLGKPVRNFSAVDASGGIRIDGDVQPGIYFLRYFSSEREFTVRVVVQ